MPAIKLSEPSSVQAPPRGQSRQGRDCTGAGSGAAGQHAGGWALQLWCCSARALSAAHFCTSSLQNTICSLQHTSKPALRKSRSQGAHGSPAPCMLKPQVWQAGSRPWLAVEYLGRQQRTYFLSSVSEQRAGPDRDTRGGSTAPDAASAAPGAGMLETATDSLRGAAPCPGLRRCAGCWASQHVLPPCCRSTQGDEES